jgi:hypothetical protein
MIILTVKISPYPGATCKKIDSSVRWFLLLEVFFIFLLGTISFCVLGKFTNTLYIPNEIFLMKENFTYFVKCGPNKKM